MISLNESLNHPKIDLNIAKAHESQESVNSDAESRVPYFMIPKENELASVC